jgi:hypothetical protein
VSEIRIRPADIETDREVLVDLLLKYLTPRSTERRFRWFYQQNPHGTARAWIATAGAGDGIIGSGAIIPQLVYVAGQPRKVSVMADFWVHPDFRALGPAIKLQRACVTGAAEAGAAFFDLPQGPMAAVYKRMGLLGTQLLTRLVKPLRTHTYVQKVIGNGALARGAAFVADRLLQLPDSWRRRGDCTIARHDGELGAEFSELAQQVSAGYGICVARSAEYLTWRYRDHYYLQYEIYSARRSGQLRAYIVVGESGQYADVADLFGHDEPQTLLDLLGEVTDIYRARGCAGLQIGLHAGQRWTGLLERAGFRRRTSRPLVIHEFAARGADRPQPDWFLSYGDIDY